LHRTWIRGWFSLSALLGVTWIFGFFYIQWDHNFAYAFITLNGCQVYKINVVMNLRIYLRLLQGIFIFLTRVVFNEQVKSAFRRGAKQRAMMKRFYSLAVSIIFTTHYIFDKNGNFGSHSKKFGHVTAKI